MKIMLCDGWATFGSANFDTLSMRINRELNLASRDPATLRELETRIFLPDFRRSRPFRPDETGGLLNHVAESIADHL
jgi:cardiolipin synthase